VWLRVTKAAKSAFVGCEIAIKKTQNDTKHATTHEKHIKTREKYTKTREKTAKNSKKQ
jgi:hypothetical protein